MVEFNLEVGVEVKIEVAALILFNLHAPQQLITYYLLRGAAIDLLLLLYIYEHIIESHRNMDFFGVHSLFQAFSFVTLNIGIWLGRMAT